MGTVRSKKVWLISWEWMGDHASRDEEIVAVLNSRLSESTVKDFVERLYASLEYSPIDKLAFAKSKGRNPYPAQFGSVEGVTYSGHIFCGHNPWLFARQVRDMKVEIDEEGREHASWEEVPKPKLPKGLGDNR